MLLLIRKMSKRLLSLHNVVLMEGKTKGRKRHIAVDTMGNLLFIKVHAANIHDTVSGGDVFAGALKNIRPLREFVPMLVIVSLSKIQ